MYYEINDIEVQNLINDDFGELLNDLEMIIDILDDIEYDENEIVFG